ncbi:MAG: DNA-processing protein DprA, partial [Myxococcota bacterium]
MTSSPIPLAPSEEDLAWVALAASGFRLRHAEAVAAAGGPQAVMGLPAREIEAHFPVLFGRALAGQGNDWPHRGLVARTMVRGWVAAERSLLSPPALQRLKDWGAAPLVLFGRGESRALGERPTVAIVGARAASPRGRARSAALATCCAEADVIIVSGGARGVDLAAHEAALRAGGETWVVLGEPVSVDDRDVPERVARLRSQAGALCLSPHGPWVARHRRLWASRNAVIAALADAVVVIEGAEGSGTVYTVQAMRRLGRPVFAVPGDPDDPLSVTPNELIRRREAEPLLKLTDVLTAVFQGRGPIPPPHTAVRPTLAMSLSPAEERLLAAIGPPHAARPVDDLL